MEKGTPPPKTARDLFAHAIAYQRDGNTALAQKYARECLQFLKGLETAEKTAAGEVVAVGHHIICEPSFLHVDTAALRFKHEGILI